MEDATESPPSPALVHAGLLAVQLGFASHYVVSKIAVRELSPAGLALVRAAVAAAVMLAVHVGARGLPRVPWRDALKLAGCAALGIAGNQLLFFSGLRHTTASNASVLVTTIPVFTLLVSLALRRERATARGILGIALALSGVIYLLGAEALTLGPETVLGDLMIVGNSLFYGTYLVLVADLARRHGSMTAVVWLFGFGALWVAPFGAGALVADAPSVRGTTWWLVAYIVLVPTIFTYLTNAWALRHAPPSIVAVYIYLQPVGATALAVFFLDETPTPRLFGAAALVFAGIFLVTRRAASRVAEGGAPEAPGEAERG
ncbi:MAG: DMT family transporter [Myxococcota bacterium]|nr:DMT family transporter [Myxococcota bacterium]